MMYSEFIEGTGCAMNDHNFKLFERLQIIYMNDDTMSKSDVIEYGKKLMDNTPSIETLKLYEQIKEEYAMWKSQHKEALQNIQRNKENRVYWKDDKEMLRSIKYDLSCLTRTAKECKAKMTALKTLFPEIIK